MRYVVLFPFKEINPPLVNHTAGHVFAIVGTRSSCDQKTCTSTQEIDEDISLKALYNAEGGQTGLFYSKVLFT